MKVRKTLKYRLYSSRHNRKLHQMIDISGIIWNQCVAAQRDAYEAGLGYISKYDLQKRVAQLRKHHPDCQHWQMVGSQAVQQIVERLDNAYQRFFNYKKGKTHLKAGRPCFKKVNKFKSFTLKQAGWKLVGDNQIKIGQHSYRFSLSRPVHGQIKTVTIKRDTLNQLWACFSVIQELPDIKPSTSRSGGFDFGLKTFLTDHEGNAYNHPQHFKAALNEIARLNRALSRKVERSNGWHKAKRMLAKAHLKVANRRRDFLWKLANDLTNRFDVLCFETLNIKAMQRLWGRKVSDLGFAIFLPMVEHLCRLKGKRLVRIDRWQPTSQTCSLCGHRQSIALDQRTFVCAACGLVKDRDHNAAENIRAVGASTAGLGDVRRQIAAIPA
jgi:putative transposase